MMNTKWRIQVVVITLLLTLGIVTAPGCTAVRAETMECAVIPVVDAETDWQKIPLANQLLRLGWTVYRNTVTLSTFKAGSFIVPLTTQNLNRNKAKEYLAEQAKAHGITVTFTEIEVPMSMLNRLTMPRIALFYATGQKWALMASHVLERLGFDVAALSADDIKSDMLDYANVIFLPGGSASCKADAVGPEGEKAISQFIHRGGGMIALCGGAGLIVQNPGSWGLIPAERYDQSKMPSNINGAIWIRPENQAHPLWYGYPSEGVPLSPWFGTALQPTSRSFKVLGRYDKPTTDFYIQ